MPTPAQWQAFRQRLRELGQRRLLVLEGERGASLAWLREQLCGVVAGTGVWTGPEAESPHPDLIPIQPSAGRQWLGRELDLLVWDGWSGNPPDSLAALTGTLTAGGLWFWLMPPLDQWQSFADPDYARTGLERASSHPFAGRLARRVADDPRVIRVRPGEAFALPELDPVATAFRPGGTEDQAEAVRQVVRTGQGHRRRPLVITADRGRGKSAALGMAAAAWLQHHQGRGSEARVMVTAATPEAVRTLFRHAREAAGPEAVPGADGLSLNLGHGQVLQFYPVDRLLQERPSAGLVLVDEAAAIPAPQLAGILLAWPRVVYATTVHGYEGSGRGFSLRFRAQLERHAPGWQALTLSRPIRWAPDDPLENLVRRLFLLDASGPATTLAGKAVQLTRWDPARATEAELAAAFGLLVESHYRTTPGDLRQWLDDPAAVTWLARAEGQIVGVLWATGEGGLESGLADEVAAGRRRLRGHLLPQSLAHHSGFAEAAEQRLMRIVRVAVHPDWRLQGVGQRLVTAATEHAREQGLDAVGTSFGASPELLAFWQRTDLAPVRLGLQREASSGEYAVQLLRGLSNQGEDLTHRIRSRFVEHWPSLVPRCWPDLDPELVLMLTASLPTVAALTADDRRELAAFCEGRRGFELSLLPLVRLSLQAGVARQLLASGEARLWVRAVLQAWSWPAVQAVGDCEGRRQGVSALRRLAATVSQEGSGS